MAFSICVLLVILFLIMSVRTKVQFLLFLALAIFACEKIEKLPDTPRIEYKDFIMAKDSDLLGNEILVGTLIFTFEDGDGDVGLPPSDSLVPGDTTQKNLFLTLYKKTEGTFIRAPEDEIESPLAFRIPYIKREGQNKTLKGEIEVDIQYVIIRYDTIRYDFYIRDRAMHKSNVERTDEIPLTGWGL